MAAGAGVCRIVLEKEVKCAHQKFYEILKYNLHHLPTVFPEGFTDCQIVEGDGQSKGSLRTWKYILPGTSEEIYVKARTSRQDDENMIIGLCAEEGDLHGHYKHMEIIAQVYPKGDEESLVKWTVEFEKHHDGIVDPHGYLELVNKLSDKVEAHLQKT